MSNRIVDEAVELIRSCVDPGHKTMALKLSTLREMTNEIVMLKNSSKREDYETHLRTQFAMAALQGLLASAAFHGVTHPSDLASDAWLIADAMIEARRK